MPFCTCGEILRDHMPACLACHKPNPSYTAGVSGAKGDRSYGFLSSAYADAAGGGGVMGVLSAVVGDRKGTGTTTITPAAGAGAVGGDERRCAGCGRAIGTAPSIEVEGAGVGVGSSVYHTTCHDSDSMCAACGGAIAGAGVQVGPGETFHSRCYTCSHCGVELASGSGSVATATATPTAGGSRIRYCSRCVAEGHAVTTNTVSVTRTVQMKGRPESDPTPGSAAVDNAPNCAGCGLPIGAETPISVCNSASTAAAAALYHRSSQYFRCALCGDPMELDLEFAVVNGGPVHPRCAGSGSDDSCVGCGKPLGGRFVRMGEGDASARSRYHKDCVKCAQCGGSLAGGFVQAGGGRVLCGPCSNAGRTTTTVTTGTVGRGVRVNPATGKRYYGGK